MIAEIIARLEDAPNGPRRVQYLKGTAAFELPEVACLVVWDDLELGEQEQDVFKRLSTEGVPLLCGMTSGVFDRLPLTPLRTSVVTSRRPTGRSWRTCCAPPWSIEVFPIPTSRPSWMRSCNEAKACPATCIVRPSTQSSGAA